VWFVGVASGAGWGDNNTIGSLCLRHIRICRDTKEGVDCTNTCWSGDAYA
jgi:hypothetical protein